MTTGFEVSQLQTNLSDARSRELNALVIYRKAVAAYHNAIADILDWKGVKIEGMPEMAPPAIEPRGDLIDARVPDHAALLADAARHAVTDAVAAGEASASGPDSAFGRIVGVFVSPVRTFAAIAREADVARPAAAVDGAARFWSGSSS